MNQPSPEASNDPISRWLSRAPREILIGYAIVAAFSVYFCMYAFRKPFNAVAFPDRRFVGSGVDLKTACVLGQIFGYLVSKYLGSKFCSEARSEYRARMLIGLIAFAEAALLLFAVAPDDWKPAAMFANGLPLGMVWGLVVRYLEGRRSTETLLAGLSCSFIIAGAATRDIGRGLVMGRWGVAEAWMPFVTGAVFFVPLVVAVWLLDRLPPPTADDVAARSTRTTMDRDRRHAFLSRFGLGLVPLMAAYFFLTAFRDFRDHYSIELFTSLGLADRPGIFSLTEHWAMFGPILAMVGLNFIRDHRRALVATYAVIVAGFAIFGLATVAFRTGAISGFAWMALVGVGMNLAYVPYNTILFERMMAATRFAGTSVFAIQLADGIGYTGSVLVQIYRDLIHGDVDRFAFFVPFAIVVALVGTALVVLGGMLLSRPLNEAELGKAD